ncbi:MAG: hypothetical protein ACMUJM_16310 [bacterium]
MNKRNNKFNLGELLIENGYITKEELNRALEVQKSIGHPHYASSAFDRIDRAQDKVLSLEVSHAE